VPPKPKYLSDALDLATSNLGPGFQGHDIAAIYGAIKESSALKPKSEFETTAQFNTRHNSFVDRPILGNLTAGSPFAFVVPNSSIFEPEFKYDADSQTLAFKLEARSTTFYLASEQPELDTVVIRQTVLDRSTYTASNAYGARVQVEKTYSEDHGVAFAKDNWLFRSSGGYDRKFTRLFAMTPEQARTVKEDGKVLLICRVVEPWFRETVHGHEAKIDEPYETTVRDNYLQAIPMQLWIFNQKTGEVVTKLSELSVARAEEEQLRLKLKQTPLLLELSSAGTALFYIAIDDQTEQLDSIHKEAKTFGARRKIVIRLDPPVGLSELVLRVNGRPYTPNWTKDVVRIGSYEDVRSATAVITVP